MESLRRETERELVELRQHLIEEQGTKQKQDQLNQQLKEQLTAVEQSRRETSQQLQESVKKISGKDCNIVSMAVYGSNNPKTKSCLWE